MMASTSSFFVNYRSSYILRIAHVTREDFVDYKKGGYQVTLYEHGK